MILPGDGGRMLEGVKILDLTSVVFGPYSTKILSDLGAEVTKVEPPEGDVCRYLGKAAATPGMSPQFMGLSIGKKSVVLDLKRADCREKLKELIAQSDVLIHNIRGKAAEKLGIDYESAKAARPDIIHVHCTGFGQDGPYADLQAYDDVIQAATGTTSLLPRADGNPRRRYLPSLIADKVAGLHGAYAVLAAVIHKLRTGEGQQIEVPMFESFANFILLEHFAGLTFDPPNAPVAYPRQTDPDRQPFPTLDSFVSIVPYTDASVPRVFEALGGADICAEPDFSTPALRFSNTGKIYQRIGALTAKLSTAEVLARCHAAQIPAQEARDIADIRSDPHLTATGFFEKRNHPTEGDWYAMKSPVKFGASFERCEAPPPLLGADGKMA